MPPALDVLGECSGNNPFVANPEQYYFEAPATLAIAVAVACAYMWGRRLVTLIGVLFENVYPRADFVPPLRAALQSVLRLPEYSQTELHALVESALRGANPDMPSLPSFADLTTHFNKSNKKSDDIECQPDPPPLGTSLDAVIAQSPSPQLEWEAWFEQETAKQATVCKEAVVAIIESKALLVNTPVDREVTLVAFLLSIVVAIVAGYDYLWWSTWPEGSFYFCQLPYFLSIVTFKPFAVPMLYCITVAVAVTFCESTYGHSVKHRDNSGTLLDSPLPRSHVSRAAVIFVQVAFGLYITAGLVGCFPSFVIFLPLLIVPGFLLPMILMYLPCAALSAVTSAVRKKKSTQVSNRLSFAETTLVLKVAATQVVSLAIIALSLVPFFAGRLTYAEAVSQLFSAMRNLKLAFSVTFSWPEFQAPRFHVYLAISGFLISFKYLVQAMRAVSGKLEEYLPPLQAPGPSERRISTMFALATYDIMRTASDLLRTSVEATATGRRDIRKVLFGGTPTFYFGARMGAVIESVPNFILVAVGPFLAAYAHPRTMIFGPEATDEDVKAFTSDESCLSYTGVILRNIDNATMESFTAITKCVWLRNINMNNCTGIVGSTKDFKSLKGLTKLSMNNCTGIVGSTEDFKSLTGLTVLNMGNTGITGSTEDLKSLTGLMVLFSHA